MIESIVLGCIGVMLIAAAVACYYAEKAGGSIEPAEVVLMRPGSLSFDEALERDNALPTATELRAIREQAATDRVDGMGDLAREAVVDRYAAIFERQMAEACREAAEHEHTEATFELLPAVDANTSNALYDHFRPIVEARGLRLEWAHDAEMATDRVEVTIFWDWSGR